MALLAGVIGRNLRDAVHHQLVDEPFAGAWALDANHAGFIEPAEIPPPPAAGLPVPELDRDRDGRISSAELREPIEAQFAEFVKVIESDTSNELVLGKPAVWWKQHFAAPASIDAFANVRGPVLLLHGEIDRNVPIETHARPLSEAMLAEGIDVTLKSCPGLGHTLSRERDGAATYGPLAPAPLADLAAWVGAHLGDR